MTIDEITAELNRYRPYFVANKLDEAFAFAIQQAERMLVQQASRIRDLEAQHRTEMCDHGYDCAELGKSRKAAAKAKARAEKAEVKLLYAQECVAGLDFLLKALDGKAKMDTVAPMARRALDKYNERFPPAKLKLGDQGEG